MHAAQNSITEALASGGHKPTIGHVGCLVVTALLAELPTTVTDTLPVDAEFFGIHR
ncbi:MAG TPA: hypothetical protein VLE73_03975 [Candidatus Saccharimonadales bacterium]|nr:hypothetical protein [Candidatus Saccharimonadales bacterium]